MALETRSKFYFGHEVLKDFYIDFDEGGAELTAQPSIGYYSPTEFVQEIQRVMNIAGNLTYTVEFDRSTRLISISAGSNFTLRIATGQHADNGLYAIMGAGAVNLTGSSSYTFSEVSGLEYKPQFFLLDWIGPDEFIDAVESSITETGSGKIEVTRFGQKKLIQLNIDYINNYNADVDGLIEFDSTAKEKAIVFLKDLIKKGHVEFMQDRDDVDNYLTVQLESTQGNRQGVGYRLTEKLSSGLAGYYTTGPLTFRIIED